MEIVDGDSIARFLYLHYRAIIVCDDTTATGIHIDWLKFNKVYTIHWHRHHYGRLMAYNWKWNGAFSYTFHGQTEIVMSMPSICILVFWLHWLVIWNELNLQKLSFRSCPRCIQQHGTRRVIKWFSASALAGVEVLRWTRFVSVETFLNRTKRIKRRNIMAFVLNFPLKNIAEQAGAWAHSEPHSQTKLLCSPVVYATTSVRFSAIDSMDSDWKSEITNDMHRAN